MRGRPSPRDTALANVGRRAREAYAAGLALERNHAPAAAIASYRNALQLDPKLRGPSLRMGKLFMTVGQFQEAAKCLAAEAEIDSGNREIGRALGVALLKAGDRVHAVRVLEAFTRRWPNDGGGWQALGFAYIAARRPRDAEVAVRRAVALGPDLSSEHRDLGALLASRGQDRAAREEYRKAMALDPHEATVWVNLGNLERRAGHGEQALRCYREAESRDSTLALAYQGQIAVLREAHRDADAGAVYRRWVDAVPADLDARLEAVRFFDGLERRDVALEIARDGVRRNQGAGDAHLILGMALESAGHRSAALAELRRAASLGSERARPLIDSLRVAGPGAAPDDSGARRA